MEHLRAPPPSFGRSRSPKAITNDHDHDPTSGSRFDRGKKGWDFCQSQTMFILCFFAQPSPTIRSFIVRPLCVRFLGSTGARNDGESAESRIPHFPLTPGDGMSRYATSYVLDAMPTIMRDSSDLSGLVRACFVLTLDQVRPQRVRVSTSSKKLARRQPSQFCHL